MIEKLFPEGSQRRFFADVAIRCVKDPGFLKTALNPVIIKNYFVAIHIDGMDGVYQRYNNLDGSEILSETDRIRYRFEDRKSFAAYREWRKNWLLHREEEKRLDYTPKFSVVVPVYNTLSEQLVACIESVLAQTYRNYELILIDDHSTWPGVRPVLKSYETESHVKIIYRKENGNISKATNDGIAEATGEFIVFMDCDDTIESCALYEVAKKLNEDPQLDFIYSDEDKLTEDGKIYHMPFFKPDWSPDLFHCANYTNHLSVFRTTITKEIGGLRSAYNGSQDYDFTLRFLEKTGNTKIGHVPLPIYHWRERAESVASDADAKGYAKIMERKVKEDWLQRNGLDAGVEYINDVVQYRVSYKVNGNPKVSIIIPSKDHPEYLERCIYSLLRCTTYDNYEVIVVDNGSDERNKERIATFLRRWGYTYIYEKEDFNFSKMCNRGTYVASGEYLLFLNDDIEVIENGWLEKLLGHAQQKHVGAVSAKLYYPKTKKIQHCGVINRKPGPAHMLYQHDDRKVYYFFWNRVNINCIAVTGACVMIDRKKFEEVGRFDEAFPKAYNDVDLCFRLSEAGYYNVVRNDVTLYHHESISRGVDEEDERQNARRKRELRQLYEKHPGMYDYDPHLNGNLQRYGSAIHFRELGNKAEAGGCHN